MNRGLVAALWLSSLSAATLGCSGLAGPSGTEDVVYEFGASAMVNPTQPQAGQRVTLAIELTSGCSEAVLTDVLVKVISDDAQVLYEQKWGSVSFSPADVYSMTQGFNPVAVNAKSYKLQIQVVSHDTGALLFEQKELARLVFKPTAP